MNKKYKDLYAGFIIAIATVIITPFIIKAWQVTLYQPINSEIVTEVQEVNEVNDKEVLNQSDINEMNKNTVFIAVKSLELEYENNPYYFLRNNDGSLYIVENDKMRHEENYIIEVDRFTDEIVEIHFELEFEFDDEEEELFTEWFHNDIEVGQEMLNEYLGIENYTEISI